MGRENLILIAATEAGTKCGEVSGAEEVLLTAMRATVNHWLVAEEGERLQAAVAAAIQRLRETGDEDGVDKIMVGWRRLQALSSGDAGALLALSDEDSIPILPQWDAVKKEAEA